MKAPVKNIVVVLGMHRSGTSAITRSLTTLGVSLGDNLYPAAQDNPKGFWEDKACLQINERLLGQLGLAYDSFGPSPDFMKKLHDNSAIKTLIHEATDIIKEKLNQFDLYGFKDPRTSRLLPFWKIVFQNIGCTPLYVITVRHPTSVTQSLLSRNGISLEKSYTLWLEHTLFALMETQECQRVIVDYDLFMDNPTHEIQRIAKSLHLNMPTEHSKQLKEFNEDFLEKDLRHTRYKLQDLKQDTRALADVYIAYELALETAKDKENIHSKKIQQQFVNMLTNLLGFSPALHYTTHLETRIIDLYQTITNKSKEISRISKQHSLKKTSSSSEPPDINSHLNFELIRRDTTILHLKKALLESANETNSIRQELENRNTYVSALTEKLLTLQEEKIATSTSELSIYKTVFTETDQHLNAQLNKINSIEKTIVKNKSQTEKIDQKICTLLRKEEELQSTMSKNPWHSTYYLRLFMRKSLAHSYWTLRCYLSNTVRHLWQKTPLNSTQKRQLKNTVFKTFSIFLKKTRAYQAWERFEQHQTTKILQVNNHHHEKIITENTEQNLTPCPTPLLTDQPLKATPVSLIAFYLPQFHPIPENNEWWGKDFTEWTNVRPAQPQYKGHYQPRIPGELGYYDLRDKNVQKRQIELAKLYGIGGFCFYFYWFAGKRLLETPLLNYLSDPELDQPFCLCWANENWSRRWDGLDSEILIAQKHSAEDDLAFIEYIGRYLRDPRYIQVNGRPLLLVYRPSLLPNPKATVKRWRNWCRNNGIGEIHLTYTQSFEAVNPNKYDFDAAVEFPPNNSGPPVVTNQMEQLKSEFQGTVYDWRIFLERSKNYQQPSYTLFRSVNPSWDNTARRKSSGTVFTNSSPDGYKTWLSRAIKETTKQYSNRSERLIFVNAWNEWAEGAYLEPDQHYGYAYLQATRDALETTACEFARQRIVLVGHDAHPHGAQTLLLYLTKMLNAQLNYKIDLVLLGNGPLVSEYEKYATVHQLCSNHDIGTDGDELAKQLFQNGLRHAITNTTVSGHFAATLKKQGFHVVSLIHELPGVIQQFQLQSHIKAISEYADKIIFPAQQVQDGFKQFQPIASKQAIIQPQGLFRRNSIRSTEQIKKARQELREQFKLPLDTTIVLGIGYADHRKGIDLFIKAAAAVCAKRNDVYFIWVGHFDATLRPEIDQNIEKYCIRKRVIFPGMDFNTDRYYAGSDIYALTSREDPFPSVVLEAIDASLPVVAFDKAGGFCELLNCIDSNLLIPKFDTTAYADMILNLMESKTKAQQIGDTGRKLVTKEYSFRHYTLGLLSMNANHIFKISVIIPNYNYARYLSQRIKSITNQNYPIWEIIILDDASTDASVELIKSITASLNIDYQIVTNDKNSGSAFKQWQKGVELATGDYIWIAEADDLAEPEFLEKVITPFKDPQLVLSYCESMQIGSNGELLNSNYQDYVADISQEKWTTDYVSNGLEEIQNCLAIKNTIPNASGVIFRKNTLQNILNERMNEIKSYRVAGDWVTYVYMLTQGKIAYTSTPLNKHRRHESSITLGSFDISQLQEVVRVQQLVREKFGINKSISSKSNTYAQHLYEQFQLASSATPLAKEHIKLKNHMRGNT